MHDARLQYNTLPFETQWIDDHTGRKLYEEVCIHG